MEYFDQTWYDCVFDRVKELTREQRNFKLFDVGAGNSVLEDRIKSLGGQWIGFDYKPRKEGIIQFDLEKPIPNELINQDPDIILLLEVIEHLMNPWQAISNLSKMSKKGTTLILTTPNPFWSVVRIKFLLMNKFPMFEKSDLDDNHHVFTAWPHVLEKMLELNGFRIISRFTSGWKARFPEFEFHVRYPAKIGVFLLRKALETTNPISKGMCYGVMAQKE